MNPTQLLEDIYAQKTEEEFTIRDKDITPQLVLQLAKEIGSGYQLTFERVGEVSQLKVTRVRRPSSLCYWLAGISLVLIMKEVFF